MTDLKQRLERLADRAGGEPSLEGLRLARSRKARRQRLSAGLLAVVVAAAGTVTAMTALRDGVDDPIVPSGAAWTPPDVLTVWPENPVRGESPEAAQAAVDAGDESLAWRLDPEQVALRFVRMVLAWDDPIVNDGAGTSFLVKARCPEGTNCVWDPLVIAVDQPVRSGDGGTWSVTSVSSSSLSVDVEPADPAAALAFDSRIALTADVADDVSAHAGVVVANGCEQAFELEKSIPSSASLAVPAAENLDPACGRIGAGYVFIYAMDDTTEPTGDPLLEPAAIESPWLTIVPIYAEMQPGETATASPTPVRDILGITCSTDGTVALSSTVVAATASGVAVSTGPEYPYDVRFDREQLYDSGDYATLTLDLPPGPHEVECVRSQGEVVSDPAEFEVVDPNGYWVDPPPVACERAIVYTDFDLTHPAPITDENLFDTASVAIRRGIRRDAPGDVLQLGYPDDPRFREFALVDPDGNWVASMSFTSREGSWEPDTYAYCPG